MDRLILEYLGASGYPRQVWLTEVKWDNVPDYIKQTLWGEGIVENWQEPDQPLYLGGVCEPVDGIVWSEMYGHIDRYSFNPVEAVWAAIPWRWLWIDEGFVINDQDLYAAACQMQDQREAEKERQRIAMEQEKLLEEAKWRKRFDDYRTAYEKARAAVTYRKMTFEILDKNGVSSPVHGYKVVTVGGLETGFAVDKRIRGWAITHSPTGLLVVDALTTRDDAMGLSALLHLSWDGWTTVNTVSDIPKDATEKIGQIINGFAAYM